MKHSIRRQFATIFITLMAATIVMCWLLNTTLLEKYYIENKKDVLLSAYRSINDASNAGNTSSEQFQIEVQKISGIYNINILVINAGYSHPVEMEPGEGISVEVPTPNRITINGIDKEKVGAFAANVRAVRPPEPYKGKGIKYDGEFIIRKAGKAGAK